MNRNATTFSYQAFDVPSEDHIAQVAAPLGVNLVIGRDVFGKANAMTRSGAGASAKRNYVYDPYQRLCKTVEPEIGGATANHTNPAVGKDLYHGKTRSGEKTRTHHEYK